MDYKVEIYDNDICIIDSYKIFKSDFDEILNDIVSKYPDNDVVKNRTIFSMKMEWAAHNFCYDLNIKRDSTKDVDLNWPQPWYEKVGYAICGPFAWLFIQ